MKKYFTSSLPILTLAFVLGTQLPAQAEMSSECRSEGTKLFMPGADPAANANSSYEVLVMLKKNSELAQMVREAEGRDIGQIMNEVAPQGVRFDPDSARYFAPSINAILLHMCTDKNLTAGQALKSLSRQVEDVDAASFNSVIGTNSPVPDFN